jgi:hypothetical protein
MGRPLWRRKGDVIVATTADAPCWRTRSILFGDVRLFDGGGRGGAPPSVDEAVVAVAVASDDALYRLAEVLATLAMVVMVFVLKLWPCSLSKWRSCGGRSAQLSW